MFQKIKSNWIQHSPNLIKAGKKLGTTNSSNQYLNYNFVDKTSKNILLSCLPVPLQKHVRILLVTLQGPSQLYMHRDTGARTVLNWYVCAGGGITRFYTENSVGSIEEPELYTVEADIRTPTPCSSFIANDNECFLLDTSCLHDVILLSETRRTFISWGFRDLAFDDVLCYFDKTS